MKNWYTPYSHCSMGELGWQDFDRMREGFARLLGESKPRISVVAIAHNEQEKIAGMLYSLSQNIAHEAVEVIVVDNNSTDATSQIIHRSGAKYLLQPKKGVGHARQMGLEYAQGEIIISVDADTLYPPTYIQSMASKLRKGYGVAVVLGSYWFVADGRLRPWQLTLYCWARDLVMRLRVLRRPELVAGGASMAFWRKQALEIGWRTDILRGEDGSMTLALKHHGKVRLALGRATRIRSSARTLDADGGLGAMVWLRVRRELRRVGEYFYKGENYVDRDCNKNN